MKFDADIITLNMEKAGFDQKIKNLKSDGYDVESCESSDVADLPYLVAKKDGDTFYFIVKYIGDDGVDDESWPAKAVSMRTFARTNQARLKLMLIDSPFSKDIEIDGLDEILRGLLGNFDLPELKRLSDKTKVEDMSIEDITGINIDNDHHIIVKGSGEVDLTLNDDKDSATVESFPFEFKIILNGNGLENKLEYYKIDLSSWYGEADGHGHVQASTREAINKEPLNKAG